MSSVDGLNMIECKFNVFEIFGEPSVSLWNWLFEITFLTVLSSVQDGPCDLFASLADFWGGDNLPACGAGASCSEPWRSCHGNDDLHSILIVA